MIKKTERFVTSWGMLRDVWHAPTDEECGTEEFPEIAEIAAALQLLVPEPPKET